MNTEGRYVPRSPDIEAAPARTSSSPSTAELELHIRDAGGNVTAAARRLNVPRETFRDWLKAADIDPKRYRSAR